MRKICLLLLFVPLLAIARSKVYNNNVKTLTVVVNNEWTAPAIMSLHGDVLNVSFDELSHDYHRYIYRLEHCEFDWSPSEDIFESDWLEGFNGNPIDDYETSLNTTVLYTHYRLQIPNDRCRLRLSGNYRLHIIDDDEDEEVACVEFRVVEPYANIGLSVTTNTDIDVNRSHQQVSMTVKYNGLRVTNVDEQIKTIVMQNGREDNMKVDVRPNILMADGMKWEHNRGLIFDGGNEYRKYEIIALSHTTMGIEDMRWDGTNYQAFPFVDNPRRNYVYDEDANGAFYVRNSDNIENDRVSDYVFVNYKLQPANNYDGANVVVDGMWTTGHDSLYVMDYDESERCYQARILQKQGYYSYQYLLKDFDGTTHTLPEEGSFSQTENHYQALLYYKGTGARTWQLAGYQQIVFK